FRARLEVVILDREKELRAARGKRSSSPARPRDAAMAFVNDYLASIRKLRFADLPGLQSAPLSSLAFGAGGLAFALWRAACILNDADLLAQADYWIGHARKSLSDSSSLTSNEPG